MSEKIIHSFEAGRRGKPDELESQLASVAGAVILEKDPNARFDLRINGTEIGGTQYVRVSGEVSENTKVESLTRKIAKNIDNHIKYVQGESYKSTSIDTVLHTQSPLLFENECGDSGNPIAVAYREGPNFLPWERYLAVGLRNILDSVSFFEGAKFTFDMEGFNLGPDGKVAVEASYTGSELKQIERIIIASEHSLDSDVFRLKSGLTQAVLQFLELCEKDHNVSLGKPEIIVNAAGSFPQPGGWFVDEGSREAKPYRDGFASYGVCEDSFSGEDPSKPSLTGSLVARQIANSVVAAEFADFARVSLSYVIGKERVGLNIFTNGTGKLSQSQLEEVVRECIPLGIDDAIERFNLKDPNLYRKFASNSDFFHDSKYAWNKPVDLTSNLKLLH